MQEKERKTLLPPTRKRDSTRANLSNGTHAVSRMMKERASVGLLPLKAGMEGGDNESGLEVFGSEVDLGS